MKQGSVLQRKTSMNPMNYLFNPLNSHAIDSRLSASIEKKHRKDRETEFR